MIWDLCGQSSFGAGSWADKPEGTILAKDSVTVGFCGMLLPTKKMTSSSTFPFSQEFHQEALTRFNF